MSITVSITSSAANLFCMQNSIEAFTSCWMSPWSEICQGAVDIRFWSIQLNIRADMQKDYLQGNKWPFLLSGGCMVFGSMCFTHSRGLWGGAGFGATSFWFNYSFTINTKFNYTTFIPK